MNRFAWTKAPSVTAAAASAQDLVADAMARGTDRAAVVQAGGIDLLDLMKEGLVSPAQVTGLRSIAGLDRIALDGGRRLRIGALVTLTHLADDPAVRERYPALADAVENSASVQIRNVATIGGNLLQRPRCWYFRSTAFHCLKKGGERCFAISGENQYHAVFDNDVCAMVHPSTPATVLTALDASVELTDANGNLRTAPLATFLTPPEADVRRENDLQARELLTAIVLPPHSTGTKMVHLRQSEKAAFDWPLADVAVVASFEADGTCRDAAIVLGAAAPVPYRARSAERAVAGRTIDEALARTAAGFAVAAATPLGNNAYKTALFETLVRRALLAVSGHASIGRTG